IEQAYFRDMSFYFLPEMKKELYTPDTAKTIGNFNAFDVLGRHFAANQNPDPVTRVQYVDIKTYMTEDILVKVDRMSMANSLEVRAP
ncbi:MAG TPA: asparagine synthetase B, partial [Desulfobacteraceae bacterium]|nr:asparagine synthetase B [Desulfobacteraceae bacterium]